MVFYAVVPQVFSLVVDFDELKSIAGLSLISP
jgi:hypothetical protein